jgi:hypothetical protein
MTTDRPRKKPLFVGSKERNKSTTLSSNGSDFISPYFPAKSPYYIINSLQLGAGRGILDIFVVHWGYMVEIPPRSEDRDVRQQQDKIHSQG